MKDVVKTFLKRAQNEYEVKIKAIRSDNGTEFKNTQVENILKRKESSMNFQHPTPLNKMGWPKERTARSLRWQEECLTNTRRPTAFGPKPSTPHVMPPTSCISIDY